MSADACTLEAEYWLGRRLMRLSIDIDAGVTTAEERKARARHGILERGLAGLRVSHTKQATWSDYFRAVYGEPLTPTQTRKLTQREVAS